MRINEVEQLAGITKGNIRFYEKEGLLTPGRNSENGYREYDESDVEWLKKIRLLRMLDVPIEEILRLKAGALTLSDAMSRHVIQLDRRRANLDAMQELCGRIRDSRCQLDGLNADEVLSLMEQQEQEGTKFMNVKKQDKITRYAPPVVAAVVFLVLLGAVIALTVWACTQEETPMGIVIGMIILFAVLILGVLLALVQRLKQIKGGEEDAASQY